MRADQFDIRPRHRRHADKVDRPGQEGSKGGGKRGVPPHLQADRRGDHLLLGDVHLKVAAGVGAGEVLGVRGVAYLAVEGHHIRTGAQRPERITVRAAGGDAVALFVHRELQGWGRRPLDSIRGRRRRLRRTYADRHTPLATELRDCLDRLFPQEGFAVPAVFVLHQADPLPLDGPGDNHRWDLRRPFRLRVGPINLVQVVAINLQSPPPEGLRLLCVGAGIPPQHRLAPLAQAVHIQDTDQVAKFVMRGVLDRLPHGSFGHLAVAREHPDVIRELVQIFASEGDAHADGQPLPQRSRGHLDPRQDRRGMAFEAAAEFAQGQQLCIGDRPGGFEQRIQQGRRVPFREHQVIVAGTLRIREVVAQVIGQQHRHQVGGGHRRGGMA